MKIVSTDLETTGLDEECCQIIEIGAVIEDTDNPQPLANLKRFHCYVLHDIYQGEPYALGMHPIIFNRIAKREKPYQYLKPYEVAVEFPKFLKLYLPGQDKYTMMGKNFASFDLKFFRANPYLKPITKLFHHRCLDLGSIWVDWSKDVVLPSTEECLKRAGLPCTVSHTAIDDALQIISLLRASRAMEVKNDSSVKVLPPKPEPIKRPRCD